jgi:hypothetical protein
LYALVECLGGGGRREKKYSNEIDVGDVSPISRSIYLTLPEGLMEMISDVFDREHGIPFMHSLPGQA